MLRKNISAVMATILSALLFIVIGSCFSAFVYRKEIVKVENPKLILAEGISAFNEDGDKIITELKLSKMKLGLKPATGEEDSETNIPITVTDKKGSEGQYVKFKVYIPNGAAIYVTDIKIDSKEDKEKINKERENIMVSIKEIKGSSVSLKEDKVSLGTLEASDEKKSLTFYVWLSNKAGDILEASTISFNVSFE